MMCWASDDVLGRVEGGIDFEKRVLQIYDSCRQPQDIEAAFDALQKELEEIISDRIQDTQAQLLENFDEDVHDRLKLRLNEAEARLDKLGRWFWGRTCYALQQRARFDEQSYAFSLLEQDKLERWADDKLLAAEDALKNTKARIAQLKRDARNAPTLQEQQSIQCKLVEWERKHRRQRQEIFAVEDEIIEQRDALRNALQQRLQEKTETEHYDTLAGGVIAVQVQSASSAKA